MNTSGIPVYQLDVLASQAIMTQTTMKSVGSTQIIVQESKTDEVIIESKVSEV